MKADTPVQKMNECSQDLQSALSDVLRNLSLSKLNRIQELAVEYGALQGANLFVVAPSGSGKTLVGLVAALRLLVGGNDSRKAVFLVPLRALAWQQYDWLRLALGNKRIKVAIDTGDSYFNNDRGDFPTHQILVMTYERFDSLIRKKVWWLKRIKLVVIDETNYLSERGRGPRLETLIVRMKENMPETQLVALSPPIRNAPLIAEWLGCKLISGKDRPIPLRLDVLLTKNKMKSVVELCLGTVRQGGSVIVFAPSRFKANQIALYLLEPLQKILTDKESSKSKSLSHMLLSRNDEISNITRKLASVLEGGVAFHHAGLRIEDRQIIEQGFREGVIKAVACTTTLGTGINTPARMVIITDTSYLDVEPLLLSSPGPKLRRIEPDKLHQMLGRAGRPGYDKVGLGVVFVESPAEDEFVRKAYFKRCAAQSEKTTLDSVLPTVESKMNSEFALLEQLLIRIYECGECSVEDLLHFLSKTLWWKSREHTNLYALPRIKANSYNAQGLLDSLLASSNQQNQKRPDRMNRDGVQVEEKRYQKLQRAPTTVRILSISKHRIEAVVQELGGAWVNCSFSIKNGAKCECVQRRFGNTWGEASERTRLCNHLLMAAKYLFSMPTTKPYTEELIIRSFSDILPLDRLMDNGMIYTVAEKYRCTELGHIAASMYLHPLTILFIKNAFKKLHTEDELELELMINIAIKALIVETGERPRLANQAAVEKALIEWVNEMPEEDILRARSIDAGDFHELTEEVARMSSAASITARLLGLAKLSRTFSVVSKRVRHGIKEDLIPLIDLSIPSLGRKLLRKLYDLGYLDLKELARAPAEELLGLAKLPEDAVSMIKEYTKRLAPSLSLR